MLLQKVEGLVKGAEEAERIMFCIRIRCNMLTIFSHCNRPTLICRAKVPTVTEQTAIDLELPVDPNEPTYCLCNQVSYGEMVPCDNPDCKIEWFHFGCVGLKEQPKGKWYCPNCIGFQKKRKGK